MSDQEKSPGVELKGEISRQALSDDEQGWARAVVEAAVDGIITIDEVGVIQYANPAAQQMFGYRAEEMVGRNINFLMPSPYRNEHDGYLDRYLKTGERKIIGIGRNVEAKRKNGEVFPVHLAVSEVVLGERRLFTGSIHDITNQREAQREKDLLLNELNRRNKELNCLYRVGESVRSSDFGDELLEWIAEFIHSTASDPSVAGICISIDDGKYTSRQFQKTPWKFTAEIVAAKHRRGSVELYLLREQSQIDSQRVLRENRELLRAVAGLLAETMERKEAEAKVIHASKLASIGELAAGVGHEINNPVNGIINCMDILAKESEDGTNARKFIDLARSEAERIATIVKNLLTFSRQKKEQYSKARLKDIVDAVMTLCSKKLEKSHIEFETDVSEDLPRLSCRSEQLQQVIMNLIINAMHALDERYPEAHPNKSLKISAEEIMLGVVRHVRLRVVDTGIGIEPSAMDRIFDPFFTTKGRDKGTGLGLSVSDEIVQAHGGTITVKSKPREFTEILVDLPLHADRTDELNTVIRGTTKEKRVSEDDGAPVDR